MTQLSCGLAARLTVFVCAATLLAGCKGAWQDPPSTIDQPGNAAALDLPPQRAMQIVKQTLNTTSPKVEPPVVREQGGTIFTGYQPFPGQWHILRRWQERTRYRIDVTPDFDQPASRSKVEVWDETETRAASNQTWDRTPELRYPERAKRLLDQITASASGATTRPAP